MGYDRSGREALLVLNVSSTAHCIEIETHLIVFSKRFEVDKLGMSYLRIFVYA